jgi:hypothetical protein
LPPQSIQKEKLNEARLGNTNAISLFMRHTDPAALRMQLQFARTLRTVIEYAITIGAALLASYVILQGRW